MPDEDRPPPPALADFVRALGEVGDALDLGCGDGRLTTELRARRVTALDVSAIALERARRRVPGAAFVEVDPGAALPLSDNSFDLALCAETLEHVQDVSLALSELRRVLRPGGLLAVTTPAHGRSSGLAILLRGFERQFDPLSPHLRFFSARSLAATLDEHGFEVESIRRRAGTLLALARR